MSKKINKNNEELTSRREFLKKAAKAVLPVIAIIGLGLPITSCEKEDNSSSNDGSVYCSYCSNDCSSSSSGSSSCSSCSQVCMQYCTETCASTCDSQCSQNCGSTCGGYAETASYCSSCSWYCSSTCIG